MSILAVPYSPPSISKTIASFLSAKFPFVEIDTTADSASVNVVYSLYGPIFLVNVTFSVEKAPGSVYSLLAPLILELPRMSVVVVSITFPLPIISFPEAFIKAPVLAS